MSGNFTVPGEWSLSTYVFVLALISMHAQVVW